MEATSPEESSEASELDVCVIEFEPSIIYSIVSLQKALSTTIVGPAPSLLEASKVKTGAATYQFAQVLDATREVPAYKDLFPNMARKVSCRSFNGMIKI